MGEEKGRQNCSLIMVDKNKVDGRFKRHRRVRKRVFGTRERPRLCVYRSLKHMYAQLVDDTTANTLLTVSTLHKDVKEKLNGSMKKCERSRVVGLILANRAKKKRIKEVVFDRAGYRFHGRVKSLAEGAREGGLSF